MRDADYIYAVACIRAKEKTLLTDSDVQTMVGMKSEKEVLSYLVEKGYHCGGVFDFVNDFTYRLHSTQGFPHEIGVILGYPVDDVIEFENHEGQNCKYCGQWKSYTDIEKAKQCHCNYKKCCGFCESLYNKGYSLDYIVQEYKKIASAA